MISSSHLSKIYKNSWGNLTDLYQLTMAHGYWKNKLHRKKAVFHLFFRKHPFEGDFTIATGLALVADYLENLRFSVNDVQYLGSLKGADGHALFEESFLHCLQRLRFTGDIYAVEEGTIVHPHQPIIRVEAPLLEAQLIETALLNLVNFSSLIATKAGRISLAAGDNDVLEFGLRRAQGIDGGLTASRSAFIGGCAGTSNVLAGQYLDIPVKGTHAHSWIMVFKDELEAFEAYAKSQPNNCLFLVDTYDTIEGVRNAIKVGIRLRSDGHQLLGIRLDSGDLASLSKAARQLLDEAGFTDAKIVASNDLDEFRIDALSQKNAPIDAFGVGTRLVTAYDQPALGGVYKLAAIEAEDGQWSYKIKLSNDPIKVSNPGRLQVRRYFNSDKIPVADVMYNEEQGMEELLLWKEAEETLYQIPDDLEYQDLLIPIFLEGKAIYSFPSLQEIQTYCQSQLLNFEKRKEKNYLYGTEIGLSQLKTALINKYRKPKLVSI